MLGYYQRSGYGTIRWRSGYAPGCSPDEKRQRRNVLARLRYAKRKAKSLPQVTLSEKS